MEYREAKEQFIRKWGDLGSKWGINKTMAQLHALLLISPKPLCMDQIMNELSVSRGNACMNLKSLSDWGLIYKRCVEGCRKEYYIAEKDIMKVFQQILIHRKEEELDPLLQLLDSCSDLEEKCTASAEFCEMVRKIKFFSTKADAALNVLIRTNSNWFANQFLKMMH